MRIATIGTACLLACLALLSTGCAPTTITLGADPRDNALRTTVVEDAGGFISDRVAIIDVTGLIHNGRSAGLFGSGENPVALLDEQLTEAEQDDRVKAIILRLNTPGGTVTASDIMYRRVMRFKEQSGKPVVVLMVDVAASGGYYLACAADTVIAHPTTVTASIGVIIQTVSLQPALTRWGITAEALTSGPNKDAGSPFSQMTPEQRATLQKLVDQFYARFVERVKAARPGISPNDIAAATDGRIVSGDEALAMGLVDQLGDLWDAFDEAKRRAEVEQADLIRYHRKHRYVGSVYASALSGDDVRGTPETGVPSGGGGTQVNLLQFNVPDTFAGSSTGFYYLWLPGVH